MIKVHRHITGAGIRSLIYMTCNRFVIALTFILLADRLFIKDEVTPFISFSFAFTSILYAALAWIAYMRLDGVFLPRLFMKRMHFKKKPQRTYGDMIDYVDEEPVSFDDLDDDEKDACCFFADAFCFAVFLILSFIV